MNKYLQPSEDEGWKTSCMHERGRVLTGRFAHYCMDWDGLTVDETCVEADCCHDVDYDKAALEQIKRTVEEFNKKDPFQ